jgi:cation:H+ antiporter
MTWGAEASQFFIAQGFALAILAWLQTLPEFAVEAVLAWHQQTTLLIANLTGAIRLLTGFGWPMIYVTAALVHRSRTGRPLGKIVLDPHHSAEMMAVIGPLVYAFIIWWKGSFGLFDAFVLIVLYAAYLLFLTKLPPQDREEIDELEFVPRRIVLAPRLWRVAAIMICFAAGAAIIYFTAEPFLRSLIALAITLGIPAFVVIQWLAPLISELPEMISTFYFARQSDNAAVGLMNILSSNISQWTLLLAMLAVVFSLSRGMSSVIPLDGEQRSELLLTIAQTGAAIICLSNMEFAWWEAACMFGLFVAQFLLPPIVGSQAQSVITVAFVSWTLAALVEMVVRKRAPAFIVSFLELWREQMAG